MRQRHARTPGAGSVTARLNWWFITFWTAAIPSLGLFWLCVWYLFHLNR